MAARSKEREAFDSMLQARGPRGGGVGRRRWLEAFRFPWGWRLQRVKRRWEFGGEGLWGLKYSICVIVTSGRFDLRRKSDIVPFFFGKQVKDTGYPKDLLHNNLSCLKLV